MLSIAQCLAQVEVIPGHNTTANKKRLASEAFEKTIERTKDTTVRLAGRM